MLHAWRLSYCASLYLGQSFWVCARATGLLEEKGDIFCILLTQFTIGIKLLNSTFFLVVPFCLAIVSCQVVYNVQRHLACSPRTVHIWRKIPRNARILVACISWYLHDDQVICIPTMMTTTMTLPRHIFISPHQMVGWGGGGEQFLLWADGADLRGADGYTWMSLRERNLKVGWLDRRLIGLR
jgi:hypothetical protein